ncbi:hypothetical protein LJC53_05580 [Bacteroidales bacterium OttesenSCG-928-C03]|nr:hypothetical protein [Bacteroidales bacterium OttesenSCG-928-C03]MDL2326737.1 hypothetical protein [Bacteroidales bacterium OttesenSCG-928-A14]
MLEMILKQLVPLIDKNLTDEKLMGMFSGLTDQYPVETGEVNNSIIITAEKETPYCVIAGMAYDKEIGKFYVNRIKKQMPLKEAIKEIIDYVR